MYAALSNVTSDVNFTGACRFSITSNISYENSSKTDMKHKQVDMYADCVESKFSCCMRL